MKTAQALEEIVPALPLVERYIAALFQSRPDITGNFLAQLIGKKFRPALFLASARIQREHELPSLIPLAAALELLHTATLLHDDVLDEAQLRRSRPTANTLWGNQLAVLLGDYLFAKAFTLFTSFGNMEIIDLMVNTIEEMSAGEIQQQLDCANTDLTEEAYLERVKQKTAVFMAASCLAGCLVAETSMQIKSAVYRYGLKLGMAYQIIDDLLDYCAKEKNTGKDACSDIKNGIITLPLIHTLQVSPIKNILVSLIKEKLPGETESLLIFIEIKRQGGLAYSVKKAERYLAEALTCLEAIPAKEVQSSLKSIARLVLKKVPSID